VEDVPLPVSTTNRTNPGIVAVTGRVHVEHAWVVHVEDTGRVLATKDGGVGWHDHLTFAWAAADALAAVLRRSVTKALTGAERAWITCSSASARLQPTDKSSP